MNEQRRQVGFLGSIRRTPLGSLMWPEGTIAVVVGIGGGIALLNSTTASERVTTVGDGLQLLGVLLGVVFAAFALLIALFSDEYIRLLTKAEGGLIVFLRPFIIAIGCQVTTLFVTMGYRATATDLDSRIEVGVFLAWAFLFAFSLADVVSLGRSIMLHGLFRARQIEPTDATVRSLREKSGP